MSDPGATERNVQYNDIALQRASQRNGGQNPPTSTPQSVTAENVVPSRAVNSVGPYVGANDAVVSWGRAGQTEVTAEHAAPTLPQGTVQASGIYPQPTSSTTTIPEQFTSPVAPTRDRSREGGPGGGACNSMADILRRG